MFDAVVVEPTQPADSAVIWLHGLGASGHDFEPALPLLGLQSTATRFIFPHAPQIPVTVNRGMVMPAWYDILAMLPERQIALEDLEASVKTVHTLIDEQMAQGIAAEKIFIVGFSQGGAVAYHSALSYPHGLAGVAALSTYIAEYPAIERALAPQNSKIPVWVGHGIEDDVVPLHLGQQAMEWLKARAWPVDYKTYPMGHEVVEALSLIHI